MPFLKSTRVPASPIVTTRTAYTPPVGHEVVLATRWDVEDVRAWLAPLHHDHDEP